MQQIVKIKIFHVSAEDPIISIYSSMQNQVKQTVVGVLCDGFHFCELATNLVVNDRQ